jgi:hypothetical protein
MLNRVEFIAVKQDPPTPPAESHLFIIRADSARHWIYIRSDKIELWWYLREQRLQISVNGYILEEDFSNFSFESIGQLVEFAINLKFSKLFI